MGKRGLYVCCSHCCYLACEILLPLLLPGLAGVVFRKGPILKGPLWKRDETREKERWKSFYFASPCLRFGVSLSPPRLLYSYLTLRKREPHCSPKNPPFRFARNKKGEEEACNRRICHVRSFLPKRVCCFAKKPPPSESSSPKAILPVH